MTQALTSAVEDIRQSAYPRHMATQNTRFGCRPESTAYEHLRMQIGGYRALCPWLAVTALGWLLPPRASRGVPVSYLLCPVVLAAER
jgi:hypothetical protein